MIWLVLSGWYAVILPFRLYRHLPVSTVDVAFYSAAPALFFGVWVGKKIERMKRP